MLSINRATTVGNVGVDLQVRYTGNGTAVVNFRVATNNRYKDKAGEFQEETEWHNVVAWGDLAESSAKRLKKGSAVLIEGPIKTRKYEGRDGNDRWTTEIKAIMVNDLSGRGNGESEAPSQPEVDDDDDDFNPDDDLPF